MVTIRTKSIVKVFQSRGGVEALNTFGKPKTVKAGVTVNCSQRFGSWFQFSEGWINAGANYQYAEVISEDLTLPPVITPPSTPPNVSVKFPRFARVKHWHERYKNERGQGLSYLAYMRIRENNKLLHMGAGGDPAVFQLNQSAKDRAVYLTPALEKWIYRLFVESSHGLLPEKEIVQAYRNAMHGAKAYTNKTGWSDGCQSVIVGVNQGAEMQRLQLTIANGATVKVIGERTRRGGEWVYPIEVMNAQDPMTLTRTLKDAWWLIFPATNSTLAPAPEGQVDPFPYLRDFDVPIPLLANNTTTGYIEAGWIDFLPENTKQPVYPYFRTWVSEAEWKSKRGLA